MQKNISAEDQVRNFYDSAGWDLAEGETTDAALWEDLRPVARHYVRACRLKLLSFIPLSGDKILDAASGPVQYPEYLEYSRNFSRRVCVDISTKALERAKEKLGDKGEYVCASILDLPFADNSFDCSLSLHTIYHIDRDKQEAAVRHLVRVTKPGQPLIIVYANPDRLTSRLKRWVTRKTLPDPASGIIYYFAHPISWWKKFEDGCEVEIYSWRSLTAQDSKRFIPNNVIGKILFRCVLALERIMGGLAAKLGAYPVIVLKKKVS